MNILIAPDSFKESLSALEAAQIIKKGFQKSFPHALYDLMPVGDGGEGTMAALAENLNLQQASKKVSGPFGTKQKFDYASDGKTALIEMAELVGLASIPPNQRDPLQLSTKGVGELILQLAQAGIQKFVIGVGGSATNDGGIGMASGLGYQFFDKTGQEIEAIGANLGQITTFSDAKVPKGLKKLDITVITDVKNVLCGKQGATYVFGSQKGLVKAELFEIDRAMDQFYSLVNASAKIQPGSGAGGGMGAALIAFLSGKIVSGIDYVLDMLNFDERAAKADLVIVGEGRLDSQSLAGKAPVGIASRVPEGIPVLAICGSVGSGSEKVDEYGIKAVFPIISEPGDLHDILEQAEDNLYRTAKNISAMIKAFL